MTARPRIVECTDATVKWPFQGSPNVRTGGRSETIDPYPCYAHDVTLVKKTLKVVERTVGKRIQAKPTVYVLHHETEKRTNGWAYMNEGCRCDECLAEGKPGREGVIVLAGKRIPLHPAMTRYLVGHEYGHHAEYELLHRRELPSHSDVITDEYKKMRGLTESPSYYGGRQWHLATGEVIANDFRILVAGLEPEFWPHNCKHPSKDKVVQRWWEENL